MRRIALVYPVSAAALALPGIANAPSVLVGAVFFLLAAVVVVLAWLAVALAWSDNLRGAANAAVASWTLLFLLVLAEPNYWAFILLPLQAVLGWALTRQRDQSEDDDSDHDQEEQGEDSEQGGQGRAGEDAGDLGR